MTTVFPASHTQLPDFLHQHPGKQVVVVQGLGFVGSVMALVCANALTAEYAVIGVDLPVAQGKIRGINEGQFPVVASDPKIGLFYQQARAKGNLLATSDPQAYTLADVIVVDINLDVAKRSDARQELEGYDVDLNPFRSAIRTIGAHCRPDVLVLVETTVPPGACEKVVLPLLRECLAERGLPSDQLKLGHSYERVMPGPDYVDSIQNFYRVYSGVDERSADATEAFLRTIISTDKYPLTRLGSTTATEMAKVLENSFRAMNIAFMVEWSRFAEEAGVNLYEVVDAIRMRPTHRNLMYPGIGVGGYCLTKDPLLASWSRQQLFQSAEPLAQSEMGVRINDRMPRHAFEFLQQHFGRPLAGVRVLLLGISYRSNVGDTRYSPVEPLYDHLVAAGADVTVTDPYVAFWEEKQMAVATDWREVLKAPLDIVVISTGHDEYRGEEELMRALKSLLHQAKPGASVLVVDTIGVLEEAELAMVGGKVVGRGDV